MLIIIFSIAFAVFFVAPPLLSGQFGPYPLMKMGAALDVLTPLVLIPLYWLLYRMNENKTQNISWIIFFLVFAAFWVEGQGMHLSANSIGHLLKGMEGDPDFIGAYALTNFYDESLSHYLWHFGIVGLSAMLILRQWRNPLIQERAVPWLESLAGVIYGFTFFLLVIEGGTPPLGLPFAILAVLFIVVWGRKKLWQQSLLTFFFVAYLVAVILFASWAIYWHGLPQFSQVGIID